MPQSRVWSKRLRLSSWGRHSCWHWILNDIMIVYIIYEKQVNNSVDINRREYGGWKPFLLGPSSNFQSNISLFLLADQGQVLCHEAIGDLNFDKRPPMPSSTLQRTKVYQINVAKDQSYQKNTAKDQSYQMILQRFKTIISMLQSTMLLSQCKWVS